MRRAAFVCTVVARAPLLAGRTWGGGTGGWGRRLSSQQAMMAASEPLHANLAAVGPPLSRVPDPSFCRFPRVCALSIRTSGRSGNRDYGGYGRGISVGSAIVNPFQTAQSLFGTCFQGKPESRGGGCVFPPWVLLTAAFSHGAKTLRGVGWHFARRLADGATAPRRALTAGHNTNTATTTTNTTTRER